MSQTEKEMKAEIEAMYRDIPNHELTEEMRKAHREQFGLDGAFDTDEHILEIQSIKPHGVIHNEAYDKCIEMALNKSKNKYERKVKGVYIDVYDVLKAFEVTNPATQHAIKKLLAGGKRGYKNTEQDYHEAIASIYRAIELEDGEN